MQQTSFGTTQKQTLHLQFVDAAGAVTAAAPSATPVYTLLDAFGVNPSDLGVITLTPASDGLSAVVSAKAAGSQIVKVSTPETSVNFTVVVTPPEGPNPIAGITIIFDTPVSQ